MELFCFGILAGVILASIFLGIYGVFKYDDESERTDGENGCNPVNSGNSVCVDRPPMEPEELLEGLEMIKGVVESCRTEREYIGEAINYIRKNEGETNGD